MLLRGYKGVFLEDANSAFHAELVAADIAMQVATQVVHKRSTLLVHTGAKITRFY